MNYARLLVLGLPLLAALPAAAQDTPPAATPPAATAPAAASPARSTAVRAGTLAVRLTIRDYAAWRPVFDGAAPQREPLGLSNPRVFRDSDRPNDLLVLFDATDMTKARQWLRSPEAREDWRKGGVVGRPEAHVMR